MPLAPTWKAIEAWFTEHDAQRNLEALRPGASAKALESLERALGLELPAELRESLSLHDGGGDFDSYELLGCKGIQSWTKTLAKQRRAGLPWGEDWIVFAADSGGNLYCVAAGTGRLVQVERDTAEAFARRGTFGTWLRGYLRRLRAGELAVDAEGFVAEPVVAPAVAVDETEEVELPQLSPKHIRAVEAALRKDDPSALATALERAKATFDVRLEYDRAILAVACEGRKVAIVDWMLARGADVNIGEAQGDRTPLFWATWGMNPPVELVKKLLDHGAHVDALTRFDGTPLHAAAMWDAADVVRLLLERGADPTRKDASGRTPAEHARDPKVLALLPKPAGKAGKPAGKTAGKKRAKK